MKILTWMQNKLSERYGNKKPLNLISAKINHAQQEHCKEEFSDWPHGLLAIGTLGNRNNIKTNSKHTHLQENPPSSQELLQELTPQEGEEANHQDELELTLLKQFGIGSTCDDADLSLEENMGTDESDHKDCHLQHSACIVTCSRQDQRLDKPSGAINKKSLSFLVKKVLVCGTGFTPTPSLRDQVVPESRLAKIFRAIIHKTIYPRNTSPALPTAKYSENKQKTVSASEGDINDKADDGSKWVKTDSEYIVLEI